MRIFLLFLAWVSLGNALAEPPKTRNVIFITSDGLRWQEIFRGAEDPLMTYTNGGVPPSVVNELRRKYWRPTPAEARAVLMPFFWGQIAKDGQLLGNRDKGSVVNVSNPYNISYPGYSECVCGFADEGIKTNEPVPNPNVNVLEWLNAKSAYAGKIAAYNAWVTLPMILNRERSGIPMWTPGDKSAPGCAGPEQQFIESLLKDLPQPFLGENFDAFTFRPAKEYFKSNKPRVFYVNFGETDEWCHSGRYDKYLESITRLDGFVRDLWETAQSFPEFRGSTTLVLTTDHGRGDGLVSWKQHGVKLPESNQVWMAVLGPDTPALGERENCGPFTLSQVASTLARFMGEDYRAAVPKAAEPVADFFGR